MNKKQSGRPQRAGATVKQIGFKVNAKELATIDRAAKKASLSRAEYLRGKALGII